MFIKSIRRAENVQNCIYSNIRKHGLPVVIYGAGHFANSITSNLEKNGIDVYGYAVDTDYYKDGQSCNGKQVFDFQELKEQSGRYVFVLGVGETGNGTVAKKFMSDSSIIRYAILAPDGEHGPITYDYVKKNAEKFEETYYLLWDDLSRETFCAYLNLKISGDISYNFDVACKNQYFNELTEKFGSGIYVDCGAFRGDTVEKFVSWTSSHYQKIYAIEADIENRRYLEQLIKRKDFHDIEIVEYGVWDRREKISFASGVSSSSTIDLSGDIQIQVDTLDNMLQGERISLLKMDVEGSELKALHGAEKIIRSCMPALSICVYHRAEDLITIPQWIKKFQLEGKEYRFFLRKHHVATDYELVLYAIPVERNRK